MKNIFALLLFPTTALARDHSAQAGLGMAILMGIGVVIWIVVNVFWKTVFGKTPKEKTTEDTGGSNVKKKRE